MSRVTTADAKARISRVIRREDQGDFLLITQHDHALIAGELAEQFGNHNFARPEPRESALRGVSLHDCGWPLHDAEPTISKEGKPLDVFESPRDVALGVWTASAEKASAADPYAGLLVSLHVLSLSVFASTQTSFDHEKFDLSDPAERFAVTKFQHREIERQENLRMVLGLRTDKPTHHKHPHEVTQKKEDQLTFNFRMLQAMDLISLATCCSKSPADQTQDVLPKPGGTPMRFSLTRRGKDVIVDPWPFDQPQVELMIPVCRIAGEKYASNDALRAAVSRGSSEVLNCIVMPKAG
ncbi:MAG: hypothetical protein QOF78_2075 [Phycisphaerales bacterium]|jgi:hypothetical protein|nr:hypothetical protein [Phycisphaerales bacterium]